MIVCILLGHIDEEQFTSWLMKMPAHQIEPLLAFDIIPSEINEEAHRSFTNMTRQYSRQPSVRVSYICDICQYKINTSMEIQSFKLHVESVSSD